VTGVVTGTTTDVIFRKTDMTIGVMLKKTGVEIVPTGMVIDATK
jgi:hypothetical protein